MAKDRWKCPDCKAWVHDDVPVHRCDDGEAGVGATLPSPPVLPYVPYYFTPSPGMFWCGFCNCWIITSPNLPHYHVTWASPTYIRSGPFASGVASSGLTSHLTNTTGATSLSLTATYFPTS
jgi:hypothetical protein